MERVKITNKGKVSLYLSKGLKPFFKNLLELFINNKPNGQLNADTAPNRINVLLANEIYIKYHTQLSLIPGDVKLLITLSQATALWILCQEYDQYAFQDAEMGNTLVQLHQKLS
jgi:hypothetical protein